MKQRQRVTDGVRENIHEQKYKQLMRSQKSDTTIPWLQRKL